MENMICPYCGAILQWSRGRRSVQCEHCGRRVRVNADEGEPAAVTDEGDEGEGKDSLRKVEMRPGSAGAAGVQAASAASAASAPESWNTTLALWLERLFIWGPAWLCLLPVPLTVLMLRRRTWPVWLRVLLVTLGLVFYVAVLDEAGKEQVTGQEAAVSSAPQGGAPENGAPENGDSEEAAPEL